MISNINDFINILNTNNKNNTYDYGDLKYYLDNILNHYEQINFYSLYLPFIIKLTTKKINYDSLKPQINKELRINRLEASSIIASSFLLKISNGDDNNGYHYKNFISIFNKPKSLKNNMTSSTSYEDYLLNIAKESLEVNDPEEISSLHIEKLKFIMNYFKSIYTLYHNNLEFLTNGFIIFKRIKKDIIINEITNNLSDVNIIQTNIEHIDNENTAKVNFANQYIGGKVLSEGCCQEEIKFLTNPELLVGLIISDKLKDNEALIIDGSITYSNYKNYGFDLKFDNSTNSIYTKEYLIEIDAYRYNKNNKQLQYNKINKYRDIKKAILGFSDTKFDTISTGNWGCGAFYGDPVLKFLIQWYVASICNKKLNYCINNTSLSDVLNKIKQELKLFNTSELLEYINKFK